jgi:hypothetical protein
MPEQEILKAIAESRAAVLLAIDRKRAHELVAVETMAADVSLIKGTVLWLKAKWEKFQL